mmetsp:Transcript_5373/g.12939  ORF Transcript_5373/g.12939 Transcript_5373/m.12939 type:complete len:206 (+) Transcript_5373:381-998(+)
MPDTQRMSGIWKKLRDQFNKRIIQFVIAISNEESDTVKRFTREDRRESESVHPIKAPTCLRRKECAERRVCLVTGGLTREIPKWPSFAIGLKSNIPSHRLRKFREHRSHRVRRPSNRQKKLLSPVPIDKQTCPLSPPKIIQFFYSRVIRVGVDKTCDIDILSMRFKGVIARPKPRDNLHLSARILPLIRSSLFSEVVSTRFHDCQ